MRSGFPDYPEGMIENSPTFQSWVQAKERAVSPEGTAELWSWLSAVPSELAPARPKNPKLKHGAIVISPFGRRAFLK
jgi:hypothetical protein